MAHFSPQEDHVMFIVIFTPGYSLHAVCVAHGAKK